MKGAGALDARITIQRASVTKNAARERIKTWETLATVWAQPLEPRAKEAERAGGFTAAADITFRIRNGGDAAGVTGDDRVVWDTNGSTVFVVTGVRRRSPRDLYLFVDCHELMPTEA